MKKTLAHSLLDKFQKLVKRNKENDLENLGWLNEIITMLERHSLLDTWVQIKDVWHSEFDSATYGEFYDQMIKANKEYKKLSTIVPDQHINA